MADKADDIEIRPIAAGELDAVVALHAAAFGPGRFTRTAYRVREHASIHSRHCRGAWRHDVLVGSVTLTEIAVGEVAGHWLLGPLAVRPGDTNQGLGRQLLAAALESLTKAGTVGATVILVGDLEYYGRLGFEAVPRGQIQMPGPVDLARLLIWRGADNVHEIPTGVVRRGATDN